MAGDSQPRPDRNESNQLTLPSGRIIGFALYGKPLTETSLPPCFYLHGFPSSRLEACTFSREFYDCGISIIAPDRPGIGLSSPWNEASTLEYADCIVALADHLAISRFAILGVSGGGPYALACAYRLPRDRLHAVGLAAAMGPYNLARTAEVWKNFGWINRSLLRLLELKPPNYVLRPGLAVYEYAFPRAMKLAQSSSYEKMIRSKSFRRSPPDIREAVARRGPEGHQDELGKTQEMSRQRGFAEYHLREGQMIGKPWQFQLDGVDMKVKLWYGTDDVNVPWALGKAMAERLPNAELVTETDATHESVYNRVDRYIMELVDVPRPT